MKKKTKSVGNSAGTAARILNHPDKDEIIAKITIGISSNEINDWLKAKYTNVSEAKFVISEKSIETFKDNYLDIYAVIQQDLAKTRNAISTSTTEDIQLAITNNPAYKDILIKSANEELDIRKIIKGLCLAIETRLSQVFDEIQADPRNINTRIDRLLIEYTEVLGNALDRYYKYTEVPVNPTVQHNVTLQVVDQHISVFYDVIKRILAQIDQERNLETSMYFMEEFNKEISKLKAPDKEVIVSSEMRLAEAKLLNETIAKKIDL